LVGEELDLPDEIYGFGSWLLWLLATRATAVVDEAFAAGPARPSRHYGMVDGHPVPTPSLVAWLLTAAECGVSLERLAARDHRVDERHKVLRTIVSRAIGGEPRLFKEIWLRELAAVCGLGELELQLLVRSRDEEGYPVEPEPLRKAIACTFQAGISARQASAAVVGVDQVVVGEIPREPPGFVVRASLNRLADAAGRGPVAVVCALTGLRGVGKTQLAAAYARARISAGYALVGWINAENQGTLLTDLTRIADRIGIADPEGDSVESARRLREHLQIRTGKSLLVFDNAIDPDELRPFLPATGTAELIVTSTNHAFTELGEPVDVTVFTRGESLAYLKARTGLADGIAADKVAAELGDWPLGIAQASATIRRQHLTYPQYLGRLRQVPVQALLGTVPGGDYPEPAAAALLLSIQAAEGSDPAGLIGCLLRAMAALSPDGVRRAILDGLALRMAGVRDGELDAAVERCVAGSLLSWSVSGEAVIMHRLLGRVLRERDQSVGRWPDTVQLAFDLLDPLCFGEDQAFARQEEGVHLVSQLEALWEAGGGSALVPADLRLSQLRARCWAVRQLLRSEDVSRAINLGMRVVEDCEQILGSQHPDTLTARNNLANAHLEAGRPEPAIELLEHTLADRTRILGPDHAETLMSRNDLANAYREAGRLEHAVTLYEQTLADRSRVLGPGHPDTLTSQDGLARAYDDAGQLAAAIKLHENVLAEREQVLGNDHRDTLATRQHLADAYESAGQLDQAISLYERVLADRERVVGTDHPDVLESRVNLAYALQSAGKLNRAISLFEDALADHERVLGNDHMYTLVTRNNLAFAYRLAGHLDRAIPLFERNTSDSERIHGADNADTLRWRNNLAVAYLLAGLLEQAVTLLEQTLADSKRVLGPDHPQALATQDYLAEAYKSAGRLDQAIALYEQTLATRERVLGPDHPQILTSRDHLAGAYASAGRLEQAITLYEQTLADCERVLGPDHPQTVTTRNSLAHLAR
jgi:tetratricopeptide (TPR) repeat protein